MNIQGLFAVAHVSDMGTSVSWYTALIGRSPDDRPMDGLVQWRDVGGAGLQLVLDAEKAGHSAITVVTPAMARARADLAAVKLVLEPDIQGDFGTIAQISDPDGNRIRWPSRPGLAHSDVRCPRYSNAYRRADAFHDTEQPAAYIDPDGAVGAARAVYPCGPEPTCSPTHPMWRYLMALATTHYTYDAPIDRVFAVFADIGNVQEISPGIESSRRLNDQEGQGGQRACDFGDGAGIHEEVTAFRQDEHIQFTGIKFWGAPMKKMVADFWFTEADGQTTVACEMAFDMKMGWLLNPIAKGRMRKSIDAMLAGAATKV